MDLFEHAVAMEARDSALVRVSKTAGKWSSVAMDYFRYLPNGIEVTGEDVRRMLSENGLPQPHHHNAWGAFIMNLVRSGMLVSTGRTGYMKFKKSHARRTLIYLINQFPHKR